MPERRKYYQFNKSRLSFQLTAVVILLIFLPTAVVSIFTLQNQRKNSWDSFIQNSADTAIRLTDNMNSVLDNYASMANILYLDESLDDTIQEYENNELSFDDAWNKIYRILSQYSGGTGTRHYSATVVANDGTVFGNSILRDEKRKIDVQSQEWFDRLSATIRTRSIWIHSDELDKTLSVNGYPNIYLIRQLHDRKTWSDIGTLILVVSELDIENVYSGYLYNDQSVFILDRDSSLISYNDNLMIRGRMEQIFEETGPHYSGTISPEESEESFIVSFSTVPTSQWKLIYCCGTERILEPFNTYFLQYILAMTVSLILSAFLSALVIRHFLNPMRALRHQMDEVQKGNLGIRLPVTVNNELGELTEHFNKMQDSIQSLMSRVETESEEKREAEIKVLQSQINPHFLYNTLASVRSMIFSGEKEHADNTVVSLIRLMKNALSDSRELVTLDMELRLLEDYIRIQQYTFPTPFSYTEDIDPEIRDCWTIKLILQPIVENAIFHGLKPKETDCRLYVGGHIVRDGIEITVEDNGVGFDENQGVSDNKESSGIGTKNVNDRIQLYFGEQYGLTVNSEKGKGTRVLIHLPVIRQNEGLVIYEHTDSRR